MGFEPMVEFNPHTRLAGEHLQPTRSSLRFKFRMAEGVGFEPTEVLPSTVFKTAAFDHSAIPPRNEACLLSSHLDAVNIFSWMHAV